MIFNRLREKVPRKNEGEGLYNPLPFIFSGQSLTELLR
jgi:hypothetical protein